MFWRLAINSLLWRKGSVLLTFFAISVSVFVLLGVEHVRHQAKASFSNVVSDVDLIVGARTGDINLLLYSVFRLGDATQNISWDSFQKIKALSDVKWAVPISLGDSHKGYRVLGTDQHYFEHFKYGEQHALEFEQGKAFDGVFEVVLGATVAEKLNYQIGDQIILSHGIAKNNITKHDSNPFTVVGILNATGTPVDQTLHVGLQGITAIHIGQSSGVYLPNNTIDNAKASQYDLTPKTVTAMMLGLESKMKTFRVQRQINNYRQEALLAILPGVTLAKLWQTTAVIEKTLSLVSAMVLFAALLGLCAMLLASIRERQREIAVMRALGAQPLFVFVLIEFEAVVISSFAFMFATMSLLITLQITQPLLVEHYGLYISSVDLLVQASKAFFIVITSAFIVAALPALLAYRQALHSHLNAS
jgi:putative ABC transport system permease protein